MRFQIQQNFCCDYGIKKTSLVKTFVSMKVSFILGTWRKSSSSYNVEFASVINQYPRQQRA